MTGKTVVVVVLLLGQVVFAAQIQTYSERIGPCWVVQVHDGDSISVRLPTGKVASIRYLGIDAPDQGELAQLAKERNRELVEEKALELAVLMVEGEYVTDRNGRWLACVLIADAPTMPVQAILLREGLARLEVQGADDEFSLCWESEFFQAQLEAVRNKAGLWGFHEFCADQDFLIAAIRFWGETEEVYLVNRGETAIELAGDWVLLDESAREPWMRGEEPRNMIRFSEAFNPSCTLPPGGTLLVRTGPGVLPSQRKAAPQGCGTTHVVLNWFGNRMWNNDRDVAYLYTSAGSLVCSYRYPWQQAP